MKVHFSYVIDPLWELYEDAIVKIVMHPSNENICELRKLAIAIRLFIDTMDENECVYIH